MKRNYRRTQSLRKNNSANFVQRYLKGYKVHREYKEIIHKEKINKLMTHFRALKIEMQTNAQIKIRYHWFKYKKAKAKRLAEEKRKRLEAARKAK